MLVATTKGLHFCTFKVPFNEHLLLDPNEHVGIVAHASAQNEKQSIHSIRQKYSNEARITKTVSPAKTEISFCCTKRYKS